MKSAIVFTGLAVSLAVSTLVQAGDADALIARDKVWGEARDAAVLEELLADDLVALSPDGNSDKAGLIESDMGADMPDGPYMAGDYVVKFLGDDLAVMTHSVGGEDAHWSMHVWQKQNGVWKVAATASIPAGE